ncbi:MAG TPA: hypothetical protein VMT27_07715 [Actinomycetes bacterium]|nr:hypothetical protein [Actinomycetes bacterium]
MSEYWGNVKMEALPLWEDERDGQKPSCGRCRVHRHSECRDFVYVSGLGGKPEFVAMACGCHLCAMLAIDGTMTKGSRQ